MGYDMHLVTTDETHATEQAEAKERAFALAAERDKLEPGTSEYAAKQAEVMAAFNEMDRYDTSYFRLNIWGMGKMRESMLALGMAAYEYDMPAWPEPEQFGLESQQAWELSEQFEANIDAAPEEFQKWHAAMEEHRRWSPPDEPGLPLHKFGSNDGWVVTPMDCKGALALYEKAEPEKVAEVRAGWVQESGSNYFDEWIAYLGRAIEHDGFEVW